MNFEKLFLKLGRADLLIKLCYWAQVFSQLPDAFVTNGKKGGVFGILHHTNDNQLNTIAQWPVGAPLPEKIARYLTIAMLSKPGILMDHPEFELSWEGRTNDPDDGLWGGAFRIILDDGSKVFFTFSGLTEAGDFVMGAMTALFLKLISREKATEMAEKCGAEKLLEYYLENFND